MYKYRYSLTAEKLISGNKAPGQRSGTKITTPAHKIRNPEYLSASFKPTEIMIRKLLPALMIILMICPSMLHGQSDKEIIRKSKELLDRKVYDSAFFMVMTVSKTKSGKVQAIIKKAYPGLVSLNVRKANKIKVGDKEPEEVKCEKYQQQLDIILTGRVADSLLYENTKEEVYKSLSKKRSIDKSISVYTQKVQASKERIAKAEAEKKRIADSIALAEQQAAQALADSLARLAADSVTKDTVQTIVQTPPTGKRFYIIAGSFRSESRANAEVEKLRQQGFPNAQTVNRNDDGNLRICYNVYGSMEEAVRDLPAIRNRHRKDAWILEL